MISELARYLYRYLWMQGKKYIINTLVGYIYIYGIQEGRLKFSFYHFNAQIRLKLHVRRRKVKTKLQKIEEAHKIEHL